MFGLSWKRAIGKSAALAMSALLLAGSQALADSGAADVAKLNAQRASNGIPAGIAHVPEWSRWCDMHISYMQANGGALTHEEQQGRPAYSIEGQKAGTTSVLSQGDSWDQTNPWETAPIHLHQLLAPRLNAMGVADRDAYVCATTLLSRTRPPPASNVVYTYPGNGTTHRYAEIATEFPYTPGEKVGIPAGTQTGPYIYVLPDGPSVGLFSRARITFASVTGPAGPVELGLVDNHTDGLTGYLPTGGEIIPKRPLKPATTYTAKVAMSVLPADGSAPVPFARQWSFTTEGLASRRPGLRMVSYARRGRRVTVTLRTTRGARGRLALRIRRCVRTRGRTRCNRRHAIRFRHTRSGTRHRFTVRLPRAGRWAVRPQFDGAGAWADQRLRTFTMRVR